MNQVSVDGTETIKSREVLEVITVKSTYTPGVRRRLFFGHVGAVFSVDYAEEIDLLVSGSADMTVKLWSFSTGILIYSQHVYTEWVTKVFCSQI